MPKQRNHQHHRRRGPFREGGQLQLPQLRWWGKGPYYQYPESWVTRPLRAFWLFRMYLLVGAGFVGLVFLVAFLAFLFGGH